MDVGIWNLDFDMLMFELGIWTLEFGTWIIYYRGLEFVIWILDFGFGVRDLDFGNLEPRSWILCDHTQEPRSLLRLNIASMDIRG